MTTSPEIMALLEEVTAGLSKVENALRAVNVDMNQGFESIQGEIKKLRLVSGTNSDQIEILRQQVEDGFRDAREQFRGVKLRLQHVIKNGCSLQCPPPDEPVPVGEEITGTSHLAVVG